MKYMPGLRLSVRGLEPYYLHRALCQNPGNVYRLQFVPQQPAVLLMHACVFQLSDPADYYVHSTLDVSCCPLKVDKL